MRSRYRVRLGSSYLDAIDENLLILDVQYSPLEKQMRQTTNANLDGYDIADTFYKQRTVTITFELRIYGIAERNEACQKVNNWAKAGGTFRSNDREGQYLTVALQQFADINSAKNWTDPLTLVFVTERIPFWVSDTAKSVTLTGTNASGTISMDGNIGNALVSMTATANAAVTSLKATVGSTVIELTGFSVTSGQTIVIDYIRGRYLRVRANGKSIMAKLKATSSDNLQAACGANTAINVTTDKKVSAVFSARGLWL